MLEENIEITSIHEKTAKYMAGKFNVLSEDEYIGILKECVSLISDTCVIHRLTGDGDKRILTAPLWSGDKKHVWNRIQREVIGYNNEKRWVITTGNVRL